MRHSSRFAPLAGILVVSLMGGCSDDEEANSPPSLEILAQAAGVAPSALLPRFGGQPVLAGPRVVEVLPRVDGEVEAQVRDATGEPVINASLKVAVQGSDGQPHEVSLRYDRAYEKYVGHTPEGVELTSGAVNVTLQPRGGDLTTGSAPSVTVAPEPIHGGQVVLVGPHAPEVQVAADGRLHVYVATEDGELEDGDLYMVVPKRGAEPVRVELEFDDDEGHYVAELDEEFEIGPGAIEVEIDADDHVYRGRVVTFTVLPPTVEGAEVVAVGDYGVRVVPVDGQMHATIYDRRGRPVEDRPSSVQIRVEGHPRPVRLRWNATVHAYVAPIPPNVDVSVTPVRVEVRHHGRTHRGRIRVNRGRGHAYGHGMGMGHMNHDHGDVRVDVRPPSARVDVRIEGPSHSVRVDNGSSRMSSSMGMSHGKHRKHRKRRRRH